MKQGYLSEYFVDVAFKRLSAVEAHRHRSNQHEFDGVGALRNIFGSERKTFQAIFIYLNDEDPEPVKDAGFLTWYDAREAHPTRSEYRLYFPDTDVTDNANEGDLLVIGRRRDDTLLVIVADSGSTIENQLVWLFGGQDLVNSAFVVQEEKQADQVRLQFASRYILQQIGVELRETAEDSLDVMLKKFGGTFPPTKIFSAFAREDFGPANLGDPDQVILSWMEREEILFRTLERHMISDRLQAGFGGDVDAFIKFSLSVQNRRKSRAGSALENHLEYLFGGLRIQHSRTPITEGRAKPDFVFPSQSKYHDERFPTSLLTVLGVKSTCKDRWRQVLAEADRVPEKHLLTLEPGISENQTNEMQAKGLQLVLPKALHSSYRDSQKKWLFSVADFLA
ncbi:MAG: type II restriction endonuclease, partial [Ferrovibrio sp.]